MTDDELREMSGAVMWWVRRGVHGQHVAVMLSATIIAELVERHGLGVVDDPLVDVGNYVL